MIWIAFTKFSSVCQSVNRPSLYQHERRMAFNRLVSLTVVQSVSQSLAREVCRTLAYIVLYVHIRLYASSAYMKQRMRSLAQPAFPIQIRCHRYRGPQLAQLMFHAICSFCILFVCWIAVTVRLYCVEKFVLTLCSKYMRIPDVNDKIGLGKQTHYMYILHS